MPNSDRDHDSRKTWNRDDQQKPGAPPRTASEPKGSEGGARSDKTATDPASGEATTRAPATGRSEADDKIGR
jgi:hypothetical protein